MHEINLEDARIAFDGQWLSVDDLTGRIQQKIDAGDMKFAQLAAVLEKLKNALEETVVLETELVLSKRNHDLLTSLGGQDAKKGVRRAVLAYIDAPAGRPEAERVPKAGATIPAPPAPPPPLPKVDAHRHPPEPARDTEKTKKTIVQCAKCKAPIAIGSSKRPLLVECPSCGMSGRLGTQNKWAKL